VSQNYGRTAVMALAVLFMVSASIASAEELFNVSKKKHNVLGDTTVITITSRLDAVTVTGIKVNRGNCPLANKYNTPINGNQIGPLNMKYGGEFVIFAGNFCNPLEVALTTDRGIYRTSWDR